MAVSRVKTSSILQGFPKSRSLLAGNAAYEPPGDFQSIQTVTLTSTASDIQFTSIPSTYTHLQIRVSGLTSTASWMTGYINGDVGNNYTYHDMRGDGSSITIGNGSSLPDMYMLLNAGNTTTYPIIGIIDILDYSSTSKYKTIMSIGGQDNNSSGYAQYTSNLWMSTSVINSIKLTRGTWQANSKFSLYGIK